MAPYRWNYWRKRYQRRRRRRPFYRRRFRPTFQFRKRRRRTVRKKRHFRKKLKKLKITEWQPYKIRKCKIKGDIELFLCGTQRLGFDFTNYKESVTPIGEASGGPFSIQLFSLDALFTEYIKYRCIWTQTNQGLPLTRYTGARLKFFKNPFTDYIVTYSICPPFSVTYDMYMNTQPLRLLLKKHKIIVPRLTQNTRKKYKSLKIRPPAFMKNQWYFQQDICKTGLVLLTAAACSLEQPYCPENQVSNNYTFFSLNTDFFQNPCFEKFGTTGYIAKQIQDKQFYIFTDTTGWTNTVNNPSNWKYLVPANNTLTYGEPFNKSESTINDFTINNKTQNPFAAYIHEHSIQLYYGKKWPTATNFSSDDPQVTRFDELYWECRYNPDRDKGIGNKVYFKSNNTQEQGDIYTYPTKPELMISDFPLWLIFWGWIDFLAKTHIMQEMYDHWFFVVESPYIWPKKKRYIFLDQYFVKPNETKLTLHDHLKWHPKFEQQTEVVSFFAESGPFSPKINRSQCIQANLQYIFYFKWGGCPANMESIISPCQQDKFPIPNQGLPGSEVQDPNTSKLHYLYAFDERKEQLTPKCVQRLKQTSDSKISIAGTNKFSPEIQTPQKKEDEAQTEEEAQASIQNQLHQLHHQHHQLQQQLLRLKSQQKSK
nr:MAG: ORF1 [TTV-like mini virus]UGV39383.1 MAG: ORF1 [TTV-like mini virus]